MSRIVVAEDDKRQAELLVRYLEHERHEVRVQHDGAAALADIRRDPPDLLILDVMLPGLDGLEVCRAVRQDNETMPILMVTAQSMENDLLLGLELGADDYISKPYSPRELMARVRALLRRSGAASSTPVSVLAVGGLELDAARHEARLDGAPIELTGAEFRLLQVLAENPGMVFSRQRLLERIHGSDRFITERTIDVHVKNLRAKIEADSTDPRYLITVYGVGYKLADPARQQLDRGVPDAP